MVISQPQFRTNYRNFSPDPPLVDKVVDLIPSSVDPTLLLNIEVKVANLFTSSVDPTLPLKSEIQLVNPIPSSVDPSLPLESEIHQVIDMIPSSVDPTLSLESEFDTTHIFLLILILPYKGAFLSLLWNSLQVVRPFFFTRMS
jgi:hypothetical protein